MAKRKKRNAEALAIAAMLKAGIKLVKEPLVQPKWKPNGVLIDGIVHKCPRDFTEGSRVAGVTCCGLLWSLFELDPDKEAYLANLVLALPNCVECLVEAK